MPRVSGEESSLSTKGHEATFKDNENISYVNCDSIYMDRNIFKPHLNIHCKWIHFM